MKVCILGSGLSSLTLAKALVNQKIYVDLITKKKFNKISKSRTLGISKSNVEFFNTKIININKIIWKIKKIEIFSDNLKNEKLLNFKNDSLYLFCVIKNYKLQDILEKSLFKSKYFKKLFSNRKKILSSEYNLVINTDYNNEITKKYFNKNIIKNYNSFAYTTIINHERITNNNAVQIFTKFGPLAFLPISNKETSIVFSINNLSISKDININKLIKKYNFKYKIKNFQKLDSFELKALSLRSYYHDNILAFGDILHTIHPLAGQGFNMTIRDIFNLNNIIRKRVNLGLPLDKSINSEFEKKYKHKNYIFLNAIDLIHEFFNIERKSSSNILSKTVQKLGKNLKINQILTKVADQGILF